MKIQLKGRSVGYSTIVEEMRELGDLQESDQEWSRASAELVGISLHDAAMRMRRIRYDPKLFDAFTMKMAELGDAVVVTNVEYAGANLDRIEVSVVPAPRRVTVGGIEQYVTHTPDAQRVMRATVAAHELAACGYAARTGLPMLMGNVFASMVPAPKRTGVDLRSVGQAKMDEMIDV